MSSVSDSMLARLPNNAMKAMKLKKTTVNMTIVAALYNIWLILEIANKACSLLLRTIHQFTFIYWYCALNCCCRMFIVALPITAIIPLDGVNVSLQLCLHCVSHLCICHLRPYTTHSTYSAEWCCSVGLALSQQTGLSRERWHRQSTATCQRPPVSGWVPG